MLLDPMLGGLKEREVLPILLDPILGGLNEREPLPKLLLPRFELPVKFRDPPCKALLFIAVLPPELRVFPKAELLGNTLAESILGRELVGA